MPDTNRRTFLKGVGVAAASTAMAGQAAADVSTAVLDDQFDLTGGVQEALVVFDSTDAVDRLDTLDLANGYRPFEHLDIAWTFLTPDQLETVAGWDSVRRVKKAEELEWYNDSVSRESMAVDAVHESLGYEGEDAHVVVIDSGINASHPALQGRVEANYRFVDEGVGSRDPLWVDVAPSDTDTLGHGTHCAGIVGGDGTGGVNGDYTGMAPKVTLTGYTTTRSVYLPYVVAAWDHMLGRAQTDPEFDPDVVSNSYGVARDMPYNPNDPVNVATWRAYEQGILPVFAMGNSGPSTGTGSRFAKAPHVLGVAAAEKSFSDGGDNTNERPITGFSSRGRNLPRDATEYDREATLQNLREFHAIQNGTTRLVDSGEFTGKFGAGVNSSPGTSGVDEEVGTVYERLQTYEGVDRVSLTLSIQPDGQWVRTTVYDESGERVAMMGEEPPHQQRTLTFDVDGGDVYTVELEPEISGGGTYTLAYEQEAKADGDLASVGPVTLFRPGISTHGAAVMSTIDRTDALGNLGPAYGGSGTEPFYARLSGTSMACPGAAGIAALVYEAYRDAHPEDASPAPIDVIRIVEDTAKAHNPNYTAFNTGAGYVDTEAAVETAVAMASPEQSVSLDTGQSVLVDAPAVDAPTSLSVTGSRTDDGSLYTGGQTDEVTISVDSIDPVSTVELVDVVPAEWTVLDEMSPDVERVEQNGDGEPQTVVFGSVSTGSVSYFVEAPSDAAASGTYTFGPARATTDADLDGSTETTVGSADDNVVAGASTNV
ncbi:S8 family serine peptidase [Halorarius litoreus]|uniref:S8 family serine peptidase n=1 Tax=Halorarius litoreus TaxID=2962676 RepID=UPI0020CBF563|nr:S8 family serine peptidase [Halorarius litoreus]